MNKILFSGLLLLVLINVSYQQETKPDCPQGFYWDEQKCEKCNGICKSCDNTGKCNGCEDGNYFDGKICRTCGTGIKQCCSAGTDFTAIRAIDCVSGYRLVGSVCVQVDDNCEMWGPKAEDVVCTKCKQFYYLNEAARCVKSNDADLAACEVFITDKQCSVCSAGFFLQVKPAEGDTPARIICTKCTKNNCKCISNNADKKDELCPSCLDGPFYKEGEECSECTAGTDTNDYTVVKPLKCNAEGALSDGCPSQALRYKLSGKHFCVVLKNCLAATSQLVNNESSLECTKCAKGYYLNKGQCNICKLPDESTPDSAMDYRKCTAEDKNAFTQCPQSEWNEFPSRNHFYLVKVKADTSKKECIKNENFCKTMLDTSKDCTKCYDGYYLKNVPSGVMCAVCNSAESGIEKCKDCKSTGTGDAAVTTCNACMDPVNMKNAKNYYLTSDKQKCEAYPDNIFKCNVGSDNKLTDCTCVAGYYKNGSENSCTECSDNRCLDCGSNDTGDCKKCMPGYGLAEKADTDKNRKLCVKCPENCSSCDSNASVCNTCAKGYKLNEKKTCSPNQVNNCAKYSNDGCDVCDYNYFKLGNKCQRCAWWDTTANSRFDHQTVINYNRCPRIENNSTCVAISVNPDGGSETSNGSNGGNSVTCSTVSFVGSVTILIVSLLLAFF